VVLIKHADVTFRGANQRASGHNVDIRRAAHGYEPTRGLSKTNDMMSWWRALVVDNLGEDDPAMVPTSM
jgi:hypothetical protein